MVKHTVEGGWQCPECIEVFPDFDSCDEHIRDEHTQSPEQKDDEYMCEICETLFIDEKYAYKCEARHKKNKDMHFALHLDKLEKEKLIKASKLPGQMRLKECL